MDATIAISEPGINVVLHKAIALAHASQSGSSTWGPFEAGYSASIALSGGTATLENAPANKLDLNGVNVSGSISAHVGFDLGLILPEICIPPFQVCVHIPFLGTVCTPQWCITWPSVDVPITLPFSFNVDAKFGFRVDDLGSQWAVVLLIDPFSPRFDFSPMGPAIITAIQNAVSAALSPFPLGSLLAGLINTVIGAFSGVLSGLLGVFSGLVNIVLSLLDLFNVSIPYRLLTFDKQQTFVPANVPLIGDAPVRLLLSALQAEVLDRELVTQGQLA